MKNKKETAPTTEKERGDASPDGKARGFEGAEPKEK